MAEPVRPAELFDGVDRWVGSSDRLIAHGL
jgi:hypothetical protein